MLHRLFAAFFALASLPALAADPPEVDPAIKTGDRATRDAALVIGNEAYAALPQVTWAQADARSFKDWLLTSRGVSKYRVRTIENGGPAAIRKELKRLQWRVRRGGTMWIYFAGHGTVDADGKRQVLGVDAPVDDLTQQGISLEELQALFLKRKRAKRVVLVLDAGFGNVGRNGFELVPGATTTAPEPFGEQDERVIIWAATQDALPAQSFDPAKHGLFTWSAMGALRGWADSELTGEKDGKVSMAEAQAYTSRVARHVGRVVNPTSAPPEAHRDWVLAQGARLEDGPGPDELSVLGKEDLQLRIASTEARIKAEAGAFWQDTLRLAQKGGPDGKAALEAYIAEFSTATVQIEWALHLPEVMEARKVLEQYEVKGALAVAEAAVEPCDDLVAMESAAAVGSLTVGQRRCLEDRLRTARLQTKKQKISLVLIVNAQNAGDGETWESHMRRHLEEIDRSDPNLCFVFAVHLHRGELENAEEAIHWANYALENKQTWDTEVFVKNVTGLLRLRTQAANKLWQDAEKRYRAEANAETSAQSTEYRGWTKDFAREWLDYARASEGKTQAAFNLCASAAGTVDACKEVE